MRREDFDPDDARAARSAALDSLARRDRSGGELRRKLLERGFSATVLDPLIDSLREERLIDDARFVEHYITYHAGRGQGPVRIGADLRQMQVDPELIERIVRAYPDWLVRIREVRQKKFGGKAPTDYAAKALQSRFLSYRGFTGAQIRLALGFDEEI